MSMAASRPASEPAAANVRAYVIMGVSGCGKTLIGEAVARHLGLAFVEGDVLHPQSNIAKMSEGVPLTDDDRFPWLDIIGGEIAAAVEAGRGIVVSCSALKKIYRDRLRAFALGRMTFVFLHGSEAVLASRLGVRKGHFMPASLLMSQLATLEDPTGEDGVLGVDISRTQAEVIETAIEQVMKTAR
jgi:gluconokinase